MTTLHYAGYQPNVSGFGWATCNENLVLELGKLFQMLPVAGYTAISGGGMFAQSGHATDVVFMPLVDHAFNPATLARGKINLAYTFFESPLEPQAKENAAKYDVVFAGSTWCLDRMKEKGITNGRLLIQGVDQKIFKVQQPRKPDGQFRIFSGGKFEYRKGQDLVIAAFKEFSKAHADAHLVCSWFNPWPHLIGSMGRSDHIRGLTELLLDDLKREPQTLFYADLLAKNGCTQFTILPQMCQEALARQMANTDIGLFPNRCEGGTNLVLMEYASCGRKVVANVATGHGDIAGAVSYRLKTIEDENHWAVHSIGNIVEMLELAYQNRHTTEHWAKSAYRASWTWEAAAKTIRDCVDDIRAQQWCKA